MDIEAQLEMEKESIDNYFENIDEKSTESLYFTLRNYIENTTISEIKNKNRNAKTLLFSQNENNKLYRGYIRCIYLDASKLKKLGKSLYITHALIYPRKGNILDRELRRLLHDLSHIDSVYIESILDDNVVSSFESKGWNIEYSNAFIKK